MRHITFTIKWCMGMIAWLIPVAYMSVSAATITVPINSLSMTVGQCQINFQNNMKAMIQERNNGSTRISIGVEDKRQDMEMLIQTDVHSWDGINAQYVQTQTDDLMFMLKHEKGSVFIIPALRFAKDSGVKYVHQVRTANKVRFQKEFPDWTRMTKARRLATGRGVIRNQGMEGSSFFVKIQPVLENGHVKAIKGTFSGMASMGKNRFQKGDFVSIMDGQFNIEVSQNASIK
ncbi:MAG: hypothetical protein OMM_03412 [Candidatus Magnetoglobus multicellularis str. Araruama]|uniref:Uncharacterized protein n=1 Tax=Candidatus Magnetoglobus multicellularis str. Araruama TaxID=890399 RepID=A0A1V1P5M4_9BACT|nr:MAG: hypothetical protein OMM_03412 [Candidatus Magnetoglobus multicellularis str. Araruama]